MKLFLVRHGETDWNKINKLQGSTDIPLNDKGREQAQRAAEKLKEKEFDMILSSPLKRAYETAQIINKYHNKKIKKDIELVERDFGRLEGMDYKKLELKMLDVKIRNLYKKYEIETPEEFKKRAEKFWTKFHKRYFGKTILIVAHSAFLKMFLSIILEEPYHKFRKTVIKKNASISILEFEEPNKYTRLEIGLDDHL